MRHLLLPLLLLAACSQPTTIKDTAYDGAPPTRFQGDVSATKVVFTKDPGRDCVVAGLPPIPDTSTKACALVGTTTKIIIVKNPCLASGAYAKDLCHEVGHINGWPGDHSR